MFKNFEALFSARAWGAPKRAAVVWAGEEHTLEAVKLAAEAGAVSPILLGEPEDLAARTRGTSLEGRAVLLPAESPGDAAAKGVALAREGEADLLVKGLVDTAALMRAVLQRGTGICARGLLSHISLVELPGRDKLLAVTDCALLTYPTLEQKAEEIRSAVGFLNSLGVPRVKVAVLTAVERVNPKMPETMDARALRELGDRGELGDCAVAGPISYDLAMRPGAARVKGFSGPVDGDADLLVVPNITAGNILIKALTCTAGGTSAGLILGARVPVVVTSRSSPVASKYASILAAASVGGAGSGERGERG